jgi:hypothetical protein
MHRNEPDFARFEDLDFYILDLVLDQESTVGDMSANAIRASASYYQPWHCLC